MSDSLILRLIAAEYDFVHIDADIGDLLEKLKPGMAHLPACVTACKRLRLVRCLLRKTLDALDADLTAALPY